MTKAKFKKIGKSEKIYFSGGLCSNKHWLFNTAWLLGLPKTHARGLAALQKSVTKAQAAHVTARLSGAPNVSPFDLEKIVSQTIDLKDYYTASLFETIVDYGSGDYKRPGESTLKIGTKAAKCAYMDIAYATSLFFDPQNTIVLFKDNKSPIVLTNIQGDIVATIMPLNPKVFEEKD